MCLVIASWNETSGFLASEGRMMRHACGSAPTIAADDVFKCHRLTPSLVVGIVGWAHVADELLAALQADLATYDEQTVTRHMVRLTQKYPRAALQAVLMGIRDGRVHAAQWGDWDPTRPYTPTHPLNRAKVMALGDAEIADGAIAMVRRGSAIGAVFETLAHKHHTINSRLRVEHIHA